MIYVHKLIYAGQEWLAPRVVKTTLAEYEWEAKEKTLNTAQAMNYISSLTQAHLLDILTRSNKQV